MRYPISDHTRELAITDFRFTARAHAVLTDRSGRTYLAYAPVWTAPVAAAPERAPEPAAPVADDVSAPTRRAAEWALYALWGAAALAAIWVIFLAPRADGTAPRVPPAPASASLASFLRDTAKH